MASEIHGRAVADAANGLGRPGAKTAFVRPVATKRRRGRPRLELSLDAIVVAVRRYGTVMRAASDLGCSAAFIHGRLKRSGLTLRQVLDAPPEAVLKEAGETPGTAR